MEKDSTRESQYIVDKKPMVGMDFSSLDEAFTFYNGYAKEKGFSVRRGKSAKRKDTKELMNKYFVCWKEGSSSISGTERLHPIDRGNCNAKLVLLKKRDSTHWIVTKFVDEHNHGLTTPRRIAFLRSHREVSAAKKQLTMELSEVNIPIYKQIALYEVQSGGIQNMGCTETDIHNYRRDLRKEVDGHDVQLLDEHFKYQKSKNPSFYYSFDLTDENVLDKCFWADAYSRKAYGCYDDVVVFDTTYNTNRYGMKFAPFVGVNKHGQTIVFACAFLSNETTSSFVWAFEQFKFAMAGVDPLMIITDQAAAIAHALSLVFPKTLHRLCIWHIQNKFSAKLDTRSEYYDYKAFHKCIWISETPEEFDSWWQKVLEKTNTVGNDWLESIFALRSKWVPAYCNDVFSAGMTSSQRVEGTHAFFKNYVSRHNSLMELIIRFNRALSRQRNKELEKNHGDLTTQPLLKSVMAMESQMAKIYTRAIFLKFQSELMNMLACVLEKVSEDENEIVYKVVERHDDNTYKERKISYNKVKDVAWCSCRKLQAEGIPCKHLLAYLRMMAQKEYLPEVYILKRWTKDADSEIIVDDFGCTIHDVIDSSLLMHKSKLSKLASQLVDIALLSESATESLYQCFENKLEQIKKIVDISGLSTSVVGSTSVGGESATYKDPVTVRGSIKRLKGGKESEMEKSKRRCTLCGKTGHDKRKCTPTASQNMQSQVHNQGQSIPIPMPPDQAQARQQMLSQNIQNNIVYAGVQNSAGIQSTTSSVTNLNQAQMPNDVGQGLNIHNQAQMPFG